MKLLIALATYNERENLPRLIEAILQIAPDASILVIDDNSPDGTADWVRARQENEPRLKLLLRPEKRGLGTAVIAAMKYALERNYDLLLNMDADFSHPPESIPDLLAVADRFDVVIGSRYIQGGGIVGWPFHRRLMSRCVNLYARLLLGLRTKDNSGSFRCYRIEALRQLDLDAVRSKGYSFFEEILFRLKKVRATFTEVPITFVDRRFGSSKINKKEAITALWLLLLLGIRGK